jgi:hypothetical protein
MPHEDPIVAEVRRNRGALAAKFDFDVHAIFADLRARQESAGERLVRLGDSLNAETSPALDQRSSPISS